ncbi:MAG: PhzF family phenazine biosynthesis protein, partial [bacterium]|nr:PhzF family phenazine biosynthesis protein [bacterium]
MKTFIVESFTSRPFRGNPAGVCLLDAPVEGGPLRDTSSQTGFLPESTMLEVAQELNLSETAFVQPIPDTNRFHIRYFSPKMEIPLCGHATLASAKVLL